MSLKAAALTAAAAAPAAAPAAVPFADPASGWAGGRGDGGRDGRCGSVDAKAWRTAALRDVTGGVVVDVALVFGAGAWARKGTIRSTRTAARESLIPEIRGNTDVLD
jgi:hypothetical protein